MAYEWRKIQAIKILLRVLSIYKSSIASYFSCIPDLSSAFVIILCCFSHVLKCNLLHFLIWCIFLTDYTKSKHLFVTFMFSFRFENRMPIRTF